MKASLPNAEATIPQAQFVRVPVACQLSGLGQTLLTEYFDFKGGPITTALIRKKGAARGVRLVSVTSLNEFLHSHVETANPAKA